MLSVHAQRISTSASVVESRGAVGGTKIADADAKPATWSGPHIVGGRYQLPGWKYQVFVQVRSALIQGKRAEIRASRRARRKITTIVDSVRLERGRDGS